jgi:hypothetical protein
MSFLFRVRIRLRSERDEKRHVGFDRLLCAVWVRLLTPFVVFSFRFLK